MPSLSRVRAATVRGAGVPPSTSSRTVSMSSVPRGPRSMRSAAPERHRARTGSGSSRSARTVSRMVVPPLEPIWWRTAADGSSRWWASSTLISRGRSSPRRVRAAAAAPSAAWEFSATSRMTGRRVARAPKGMARVAEPASTWRTSKPAAVACSRAAAASRVLPTPCSPAMRTLVGGSAASSRAMRSCSASLPTNGQPDTARSLRPPLFGGDQVGRGWASRLVPRPVITKARTVCGPRPVSTAGSSIASRRWATSPSA